MQSTSEIYNVIYTNFTMSINTYIHCMHVYAHRYQQTKAEQDQRLYRKASKEANKSVAIAKEHACEELYEKLDSKEGPNIIYKLAKSRERRTRDLTDIAFVKDRYGNILTYEQDGKVTSNYYSM